MVLLVDPPISPFLGKPYKDTLRLTQARSVHPYGSDEELDPPGRLIMPFGSEVGPGVTRDVELEAEGLPDRDTLRLTHTRSLHP